MAKYLLSNIPQRLVNAAGSTARFMYTYTTGTTTNKTAYQDQAGLTPHANPIEADANGKFAQVWLSNDTEYRIKIEYADGSSDTWDDISGMEGAGGLRADLASTAGVGVGDALVGAKRTFSGAEAHTLHARLEAEELNLKADLQCAADGLTNDATKIAAALIAGVKRIYVPKGTYALSAVVSVTLTSDVEIYGEGTFIYTGAATTDPLVTIQMNGYSLVIRGLTFDGDEKCPGALKIENQAAMNPGADAVFRFIDNTVLDFRMTTTSIWNSGVYFAGTAALAEIRGNKIRNITRAAGTGNPGVSGTTGVYITYYDTARYVRTCIHTGNYYYNITGGDLLASANNVDFDAFKYYCPNPSSNPNTDSTVYSYVPGTCQSHGNTYHNSRGRAVKIQANADVHHEKVIRDADYTINGGSFEINLQYGVGTVRDCEFFYEDYAGPTSPIQSNLILVSFFQGAWYNEDNGGIQASGIRVYNNIKTGVGTNITGILGATVDTTVLAKDRPLISLRDVVVNRGEVGYILGISADTGADGLVVMDGISVPKLTHSAISTAYAGAGLKVCASNVYNLDGVSTPANAKKFISDAGANVSFTGVLTGANNFGFLNTYNRGADFTYAPMLVGAALTGTGAAGGAFSVQTVSLADDASHTFDRRFFNSSRGLIFVSVDYDYNVQGIFACGSNQVHQIAAHASDLFVPSTTGLNIDTDGQLNLWFTGGALNVKNRLGATYRVTVAFLG